MPILSKPNPYVFALLRVNLLGADLLAARARLHLTPSAQAQAIGISRGALAGIVTGTADPSRSTLVACLSWLSRAT